MFKYRISHNNQRLPEQENSLSNIESLPAASVHELGGQDGSIISRIKTMRQVMESLKAELAVEKDKLARERLEAESMFTNQSTSTISENFMPLHSFHSLPASPDGCNLIRYEQDLMDDVQNYQPWPQLYNYNLQQTPFYAVDPLSDIFKIRLENVEKMCQEEFNRVQDSIDSLRISKEYLKKRCSDNDLSNLSSNSTTNKRLQGKHVISGANPNLHPQKFYSDHHHNRKFHNCCIPDDPSTLHEHRSHYSHHYNSHSIKDPYLNGSNDMETQYDEEISDDSTETSEALWHLDSLYESDDN